ncbi:MAG: RNA 2',3'-cyclic phosphodiesterase [Clostridia bacterium]|nr:RNA 2',3'-cyclic phosphodiesterase [Clostridia bacterium]
MRLFIGIELTPEMRRALGGVSRALRERSCGGRFVPAENLHLTLHFIGESEDLSGAASAMREACRGIRPFTLSLGGYGYFDKTRSGSRKVSLVTVGGDLDELSVLHETLGAALLDRGFALDRRRYVPHITLGRSVEHDELVEEELKAVPVEGSMTVRGITLFESSRINGKLTYSPLHREYF